MSLIDEALKRAHRGQADKGTAPRGVPDPWRAVRPPIPGRVRHRQVAATFGAGIVGGLVVAAALLLSLRKPTGKEASRVFQTLRQERARAAITAPTVEVKPPDYLLERRLKSSETPSPSANPPGSRTEALDRAVPESSAQLALPIPEYAGERQIARSPDGQIPPARSYGLVSGKTYAGEIPLPAGGKIRLNGIVFSETNPVAVINDRFVYTGGLVEGFVVEKIEPERVELSSEGIIVFVTPK